MKITAKRAAVVYALILAFLMIAGAATVVFSLIAGILHSGEDHTGHDHAEVQYVQNI